MSAEHDISILSARHLVSCLSQSQYTVHVCYITPQGQWWKLNNALDVKAKDPADLVADNRAQRLLCLPGEEQPLRYQLTPNTLLPCDCVMSVLHGTGGEDGLMQGCLHTLSLPMVGCGTLASAVCMAKHVAKPLLESAGVSTAAAIVLYRDQSRILTYEAAAQQLGPVLFIKPSSQGSSVGVSKVSDATAFTAAVEQAFYYDDVVLIEQAIVGREIECSVIVNQQVEVAVPRR